MDVDFARTASDREATLRRVEEAAKRAMDEGSPFLAYDLASQGDPANAALALVRARASLKIGAREEAAAILDALAARELPADQTEEALGLMARMAKDRWRSSAAAEDARRARDLYLDAFRRTGRVWTGVNAATMTWILGEEAAPIAEEVLRARGDDYWTMVSRGEAMLLLGRDARELFARAAKIGKPAMRASTREQLSLLAARGMNEAREMLEVIPPPSIVVFTGHRVGPNFPRSIEGAVREAIERTLEELRAEMAFGSAAAGSDILFAEAMRARGAVHLVLPFRDEDFIETSVGEEWAARFEACKRSADAVTYVTPERYFEDEELFELANRVIAGLAGLHARALGAEPVLAAVLGEGASAARGGTKHFVESWGGKVARIDLAASASASSLPPRGDRHRALPAEQPPRTVKALLFADVVGYSKLEEQEAPFFVHRVLKSIRDAVREIGVEPRLVATWGDGIYVVGDRATDIARYALRLRDAIDARAWGEVPRELAIRIGVHAGPVFEAVDPLTDRTNFFGANVTRTARIEPITRPGRIYASEVFAALLQAENPHATGIDIPYVGKHELAKGYGALRVYELRSAGDAR